MNWNAVIAICTALAAVFTAAMAWFTRKSIVESHAQYEKTRAQSEQHHQDAFRPVVVLSPFEGVEPEDRSNVIHFDPAVGSDERRFVMISGILRNVGTGPALGVRLHFRAMGKQDYGFILFLAPIGVGEKYDLASRGPSNRPLRYPVRPTPGFNAADIAFAGGTGWDLVIEYEDVFGNAFHTIHRKDPQQLWTTCGKDPAPPGVDPAVVNANQAAMSASAAGRDDGPVGPGSGL